MSTGSLKPIIENPLLSANHSPKNSRSRPLPLPKRAKHGKINSQDYDTMQGDLELVKDFGLMKVSKSNSILRNPQSISSKYLNICMSDFWGDKDSQIIEKQKRLSVIKRKLQHSAFIEEIKDKKNLRRPSLPHTMDENLKLRLAIERNNRRMIVRNRRPRCLSYQN
jgi:hypothetical protein